jgi:glycosyltransferase involved in cell wall biosynthesis
MNKELFNALGISVITVTLNQKDNLLNTINSILQFRSANPNFLIEHIIVDGNSLDGTVELLNNLKNPTIRYISENDNGMYQAMNKGVKLASFNYLVFINAGDIINIGTVSIDLVNKLKEGLKDEKLAGFAFSAIYKIGIKSRLIKSRYVTPSVPIMPSLHQGMLYKRSLLLTIPFDENFRICGDYEQFSRLLSNTFNFIPVDEVFSTLYTGGVSTNSPFRLYRESTRITDKYFKLSFLQKIVANSKLIVALSYVQIILFYSFVIKKIKLTKCLILK